MRVHLDWHVLTRDPRRMAADLPRGRAFAWHERIGDRWEWRAIVHVGEPSIGRVKIERATAFPSFKAARAWVNAVVRRFALNEAPGAGRED